MVKKEEGKDEGSRRRGKKSIPGRHMNTNTNYRTKTS